jgi:hypothetical protein
MCAPGEYHLAETAGWADPFTYGMPVVLSAYAGIAAAVASTRRRGDRGRWSAIIGACLALGLAMAAQVVSHLITTGHVIADQPVLIAVTSLVPPAVVGHLLHLAASPPDAHQDTQGATASTAVPSVSEVATEVLPKPDEPPTVTLDRVDEQDADGTPELPPGTGQDAEDAPPSPPVLLTSKDVAERYGVDPSTVRSWVSNETLKVHEKTPRGHNLFHPDNLPQEVSR